MIILHYFPFCHCECLDFKWLYISRNEISEVRSKYGILVIKVYFWRLNVYLLESCNYYIKTPYYMYIYILPQFNIDKLYNLLSNINFIWILANFLITLQKIDYFYLVLIKNFIYQKQKYCNFRKTQLKVTWYQIIPFFYKLSIGYLMTINTSYCFGVHNFSQFTQYIC